MNKQEAINRLDALDAEAKALRAIIEAEPKREPRGLCWVWDNDVANKGIRRIKSTCGSGLYIDDLGSNWKNAIPLTDDEMCTYRGRWE